MYQNIIIITFIAVFTSSCLDDNDAPDKNLREILAERTELSIFEEGISRLDIYENLDAVVVTLFAPSDQAFQAYFNQNGYNDINGIPMDTLEGLINYHIIAGAGRTNDTQSNYYASSNTNSPSNLNVRLLVENTGNSFVLNNTANSIIEDIEGINGVIHIIDEVLTPPTVRDFLNQNENLTVIRDALESLNILDSIDNGYIHTLFTPVDDAFKFYTNERQIGSINDLPDSAYQRLVKSHVLRGNRDLESLLQEVRVPTIDDSTFLNVREAVVNPGLGSTLFIVINDSSVVRFGNIQATDGIIHFVTDVIPVRF